MEKYARNMGIISQEEFTIVKSIKILLVGVGGLGGYVASSLIRLGVENLTIMDFDDFEESNLNRQIFSSVTTLNKSKVEVTKEKLLEINPNAEITAIHSRYDKAINRTIYNDIDIVFDGVDNIESKLLLEEHCTQYKKPFIHGAIGGWYGQLGIILPNAFLLRDIYKDQEKGLEKELLSPTFTPGIIGNMMVSEFLKFILKKDSLTNKILFVDLLNHSYRIMYEK